MYSQDYLQLLKELIRSRKCDSRPWRTSVAGTLSIARKQAEQDTSDVGSRRQRVLDALSWRWGWRAHTAEAVGLVMSDKCCDAFVAAPRVGLIRKGKGNRAIRRIRSAMMDAGDRHIRLPLGCDHALRSYAGRVYHRAQTPEP